MMSSACKVGWEEWVAAENGAEECRNPPNHLPQAAGRAGTHMRPNRPAPGGGGTVQFSYTLALCVCYPRQGLTGPLWSDCLKHSPKLNEYLNNVIFQCGFVFGFLLLFLICVTCLNLIILQILKGTNSSDEAELSHSCLILTLSVFCLSLDHQWGIKHQFRSIKNIFKDTERRFHRSPHVSLKVSKGKHCLAIFYSNLQALFFFFFTKCSFLQVFEGYQSDGILHLTQTS